MKMRLMSSGVWIVMACGLMGLLPLGVSATDFTFQQNYIDTNYGGNGKPGWVRSGDMDDDGDIDIVAGGGNAMYIYENDGNSNFLSRHGSLGDPGANGATIMDVDQDGNLDVVSARYNEDLLWWENPGVTLSSTAWTPHIVDSSISGLFLHDMIVVDLDKDGFARELVATLNPSYWDSPVTMYWYEPGSNAFGAWNRHVIETNRPGPNNNHAGTDAADLDGDGDIDIPSSNGWYESPGDPTGSWSWHQESSTYGISNNIAADVDGDTEMDMVIAAGHHGNGLYWLEHSGSTWTQRTIDSEIVHPEGLQVLDLDGDGDMDIVTSDLDFDNWDQQVHNLYVFENLGGNPVQWRKQNVAPNSYPSHKMQVVDINQDGKMDIISESAGYGVISYYENTTAPDADFDGNGQIDSQDLALWQGGYGITNGATHGQGDADSDANVDGMDFITWQQQYGTGIDLPGNAAVPETTSIVLLLTSSGIAIARYRMNRR